MTFLVAPTPKTTSPQRFRPWNLGKLVGQNPPLKLPADDRDPEGDRTAWAVRDQAANAKWADAVHSIPASLYWLSGEAPADTRWDPFDPERHMLRCAPGAPTSIDPAYVDEMVEVFGRTGFHAPLNYYRAIDTFFAVASRAFAGCVIAQPSFFLTGEADGLNAVRSPTKDSLRETLPGLCGFVAMAGVGHWPQLEAPAAFNATLLGFLGTMASNSASR